VDFWNLNKCSLKDKYPLPNMDHILHKVVGGNKMSMMDGFSRYNQVAMNIEDRDKTTFTTPWGTFMYDKMPFVLINAGANFQRAMDITFVREKDRFNAIYIDDMNVYSNKYEDHIKNLRQNFVKCKKFGLSLNPQKSYFSMKEGKLLGHIISKEGVKIDLERVETIKQFSFPRNMKEVQYFLGKIKFLRRFIPNFNEMVKHITNMLKKDHEVKWTIEAKESF